MLMLVSRRATMAFALTVCLTLAGSPVASPSLASSPAKSSADGGEKTRHYEVPLPATRQEALALLKSGMSKIEAGLAAKDLGAVHEASYGVESAIARLAKDPGYDGLNATVAPRVEIVHLASELGDLDTLKAAVPSLVKALKDSLVLTN